MGDLYIPARAKIKGPWLIGQKALEALEPIMAFIDKKLDESLEVEIEADARDEMEKIGKNESELKSIIEKIKGRSKYRREGMYVSVLSDDGKELYGESIVELLKDQRLRDFKPVEISISISKGKSNEFVLDITRKGNGSLSYSAEAFDDNIRGEINYKVEQWIENNKPILISRVWSEYGPTICFVLFFTALISFFNIKDTVKTYSTDIKKQAKELADKGVTKDNQLEAIELILRLESGSTLQVVSEHDAIDESSLKIFIASVILFVLIVIRPLTTIGIGKLKSIIKFYEAWMYVAYILIPTTIIIPLIFEKIKNFF